MNDRRQIEKPNPWLPRKKIPGFPGKKSLASQEKIPGFPEKKSLASQKKKLPLKKMKNRFFFFKMRERDSDEWQIN